MAKVKKMALGGMGKTVMPGSRNTQTPVGSGFKPTVLPSPRGGMTRPGFRTNPPGSSVIAPRVTGSFGPKPSDTQQLPVRGGVGLGAAMNGPKTGIGTAMGMNKMAGAGAALGKKMGMKKGGKVSSASKRADSIAQRGKTRA